MVNRSPYTLRAAFYRQRVLIAAFVALFLVVLPVGICVSVPMAGYVLAGLLGCLGVARLLLPVEALGALVVRRRGVDVAMLWIVALGIALLSASPAL